jgi:hypothetical protein
MGFEAEESSGLILITLLGFSWEHVFFLNSVNIEDYLEQLLNEVN